MSIIPDSLKHRSLNKPLDPFYKLLVTIKIHCLPLKELRMIAFNTKRALDNRGRFLTERAYKNVELLYKMLVKRINTLEYKYNSYRDENHLVTITVNRFASSITFHINFIDKRKNVSIDVFESSLKPGHTLITVNGGKFDNISLLMKSHDNIIFMNELDTIRDESDVRRILMEYFMKCFNERLVGIPVNHDKFETIADL